MPGLQHPNPRHLVGQVVARANDDVVVDVLVTIRAPRPRLNIVTYRTSPEPNDNPL